MHNRRGLVLRRSSKDAIFLGHGPKDRGSEEVCESGISSSVGKTVRDQEGNVWLAKTVPVGREGSKHVLLEVRALKVQVRSITPHRK